jgi:hypothetical protein
MRLHVACTLLASSSLLAAPTGTSLRDFRSPAVAVCQSPRLAGSSTDCAHFRRLTRAESKRLLALLRAAEAQSTPLAQQPPSPLGPMSWGIFMSEEHMRGGGSADTYFTLDLSTGVMSPPLDPARGYVSLPPAVARELQSFLAALFKGHPEVAA